MKKTDFNAYDKEYFQKIISESTSVSEILKKLGIAAKGSNHTKLSKFLKESDFDISTLVGRHIKRYNDKGIPKKWLSEILKENGSGNSNALKKRLIDYGVKKYKCENPKCGITEWCGEPIELELHHINGNHYDNRLENLVLLCPNCHSQTSNFRTSEGLNKILSDIAIKESKSAIENLLEYESKRKEEIIKNKVKYGKVTKAIKKECDIKYCEQCGKPIEGRGKKFCSLKCLSDYKKANETIKTETIVKESKNCKSLLELAKHFNMSDNGIKKRLKRDGKFEEVRKNLKNNS